MYIDANDAAALVREEFGLRVTADELARLARAGHGPAYRRLDNRRRLYRADDVREWVEARLGPMVITRDLPAPTHHFRQIEN